MTPTYPNVTVNLSECDSNVFALIGTTVKALKRAGIADSKIKAFKEKAYSSVSYDEVIQTIMATVEVT